jgi:membrane protease YdiL (CAAX protease family)
VTLYKVINGLAVVLFWTVLLGLTYAAQVPLVDAILLALLLAAVPTFSLAQIPLIRDVQIERLPVYWSSIFTLGLIGTACWFIGTREGGAAALGLVAIPRSEFLGWTVGVTLTALLIMFAFRQITVMTGGFDSPLLRQLLPRSPEERRLFLTLSVAAGSGEELAYRGYAIPVLTPLIGLPGAAVLTTLVFGIMHGYQGWLGIARTTIVGGVLAYAFIASGSLWPPIAAHILIDVFAGITLGERLLVTQKGAV